MPSIVVRKASRRDSGSLVELADELVPLDDWSGRKAMLEESLDDPGCQIYVAEANGKLAGFIELRVFPDFVEGQPIAIILNLIVAEAHRRLGIGSELMQRAIEDAERRNAIETHVWIDVDNQRAIDFYTKHGFGKRQLLLERER